MHLDIWIRGVEIEIIFKRYWLRVRDLCLERVSGKNMGYEGKRRGLGKCRYLKMSRRRETQHRE